MFIEQNVKKYLCIRQTVRILCIPVDDVGHVFCVINCNLKIIESHRSLWYYDDYIIKHIKNTMVNLFKNNKNQHVG